MILTLRDKAILRGLQSYGLFTTRHIAAKYFPEIAMTTVLRRLRSLESAGYIQRISGLDGGQHAWTLTRQSAEAFLPQASKIHFPRFILDHDLTLLNLRLGLEGAEIACSWRPEHEIRSRVASRHGLKQMQNFVVPDGLVGVQHKGLNETVAVELELSAKNQKRYRSIFWDYAEKENLWAVWYVVRTAGIGRQVAKAAKAYLRRGPYFLWSVLDDVIREPLNASAYGFTKTYRICDLWKSSAAHMPAQGVSRQKDNTEAKEAELSALVETKTPAPHAI